MGQIQDGLYVARPNHWNVGKSKGGAVEIAINFELEAWINPKTQEEIAPAQPTYITGFFYPITKTGARNDNTMESLKAALGWDGRSFGGFQSADWSQTRVKIVIAHEPDLKNKLRPKVQFINPLSYVPNQPKQVDDKLIADLDAQFDSLLIAGAAASTPAADSPQAYEPPAEPPAVPTDVDMGFDAGPAWALFCKRTEGLTNIVRVAKWIELTTNAKTSNISADDFMQAANEVTPDGDGIPF